MTSKPQPSSLWRSADEQDRIAFNKWGLEPYTSLYCMEVGGGDTGFPYLELTVLQQGPQFLAAHGVVIMEQSFESAESACAAAVQWGIDHGWDAKLFSEATQLERRSLSWEALRTEPVSIQAGIATCEDGSTVNLLAIQAACNAAFQDSGENELAQAADALSKLTGLWQGPHGGWFLNADQEASHPIDVGPLEIVQAPKPKSQEATNRLVTDTVFADAAEPVGMHWRNLCTLENELGTMLLQHPGAIVTVDSDAWVLRSADDTMVLCHATVSDGKLVDEQSRHDFDLDWVDIGEDELAHYNSLLTKAIDEFAQRVIQESDLERSLLAKAQCAHEGSFCGQVIAVDAGVVTQRINRQGKTALHDASKLSSMPAIGDVVDIQYRNGRGHVSGKGHTQGHDR